MDLRSFAKVRELTQLLQKLVEIELALLDEPICHITFCLLGWDRRNEKTRVPTVQEVSENEELTIPSVAVDFSETIVALNQIHSVLLHSNALLLVVADLNLHNAVVALDVVHFEHDGRGELAGS